MNKSKINKMANDLKQPYKMYGYYKLKNLISFKLKDQSLFGNENELNVLGEVSSHRKQFRS